ncbi:MAG: SufD family Fe-S cluster assembly protein [Weeksellaceae bacterium]
MTTLINLNTEKHPLVFNKKGTYVVFFHNLSGKLTFDITATGVNLYIFGLFTGKDKDEFNIETIQRHSAPGSLSDLLIKGVFDDQSRLIYQGLIRLEKDAQQSHAYQKNQNLVLSKGTFIDSRPFLEILANDVFCTHGSTTGKLNEEQFFYAKSRGLDDSVTRDLLVSGFTQEVIDKVQSHVPEFSYSLS